MADELFHIQSDSPAAPEMLFSHIAGHECLSRPSAYELWVLSKNAKLSAQDVLGHAFDVVIDFFDADGGKHQRHCQGHAVRFMRGAQVGRYYEYRITLRSWFWLLTKRSNSRVLQDKTVVEILDAVCDDSPITQFKKTDNAGVIGSHPPRRYCVQFNETDYNYLSRLFEEEGIYYWFDAHDAPGTMYLSDTSSAAHQKLPAAGTLKYHHGHNSEGRQAEIMRWSNTGFFDTGKHATRDRNFKTVRQTVGANINAAGKYKLADLEVFEFPGVHYDNGRAEDLVKVRGDELSARRERHWGLSTWPDIAAGRNFSFEGDPDGTRNGDYLIGACTFFVSHPGREGLNHTETVAELQPVWQELLSGDVIDQGAGEAIVQWLNQSAAMHDDRRAASVFAFTALPAAVNYRAPRTTPRQTMPGPQSAFVVGPAGAELHVDDFGRVKVQFHWDRYGSNDDKSSCWVRVSQPWAGKNWGGYFIPRIGQEVIVDFLDGNPDRPVIVGRVYNDDQPIPFQTPTQSGFRTRSTPGGSPANCNEFRFEDQKGSEQVYLHAERNQDIEVEVDETHSVGHDRTKSVGHDQTVSIGHDENITIGNDRTRVVRANDVLMVGKKKTDSIGNIYKIEAGDEVRIVCGDTVLEMHANGQFNITCKNFNISAEEAGQINTKSGLLDLNMEGGGPKAEKGEDGNKAKIQAAVEGFFKK